MEIPIFKAKDNTEHFKTPRSSRGKRGAKYLFAPATLPKVEVQFEFPNSSIRVYL